MLRSTLFFAFLVMSAGMPANASEPLVVRSKVSGAESPAAMIGDLAFLAGHWIGDGLGGCAEEIIAEPSGGQMMGMFRQMKPDGTLMFYEFYTFAEEGGSVALRIKHFNPDHTGWEEKDDFVKFPLVALEGSTAFFDGLTFARAGRRGFQSAVMIEERGVEQFVMRKAKEGGACGN